MSGMTAVRGMRAPSVLPDQTGRFETIRKAMTMV